MDTVLKTLEGIWSWIAKETPELLSQTWGYVLVIAPKLLFAALILVVGHFLIKLLVKFMHKAMDKFALDRSLINFLDRALRICLYIVLFLVVLATLGIPTAGIIAAFSAAAAAVALALKDSLSNIASGILLLFSRPFATGDFIDVGGDAGTVEDIDLMHTVLRTPDNKHIIIPNGQMTSTEIINYSAEQRRRVDIHFTVSYKSDIDKAKAAIFRCIEAHPLTLDEEEGFETFVRVSEYLDSSVKITARLWVEAKDYWEVYFDLLENVKKEFDREGISIPFNQLDVHITKD